MRVSTIHLKNNKNKGLAIILQLPWKLALRTLYIMSEVNLAIK